MTSSKSGGMIQLSPRDTSSVSLGDSVVRRNRIMMGSSKSLAPVIPLEESTLEEARSGDTARPSKHP